MISINIVAIPTELAEAVCTTQKSPRYGHPVYTAIATGYGPCRHCLKAFRVGEEQLTLFTHDPFEGIESLPLPGPVFVHTNKCERYPEDAGYPQELLRYPSVLDAYAKGRRLLSETVATEGSQPEIIQRLFENPEVQYVHVRDKSAGCYDFRVERR